MAFFTDSEMIKYYQKMYGQNSRSTKTKNVKNYAKYTMIKNHLCFTLEPFFFPIKVPVTLLSGSRKGTVETQ